MQMNLRKYFAPAIYAVLGVLVSLNVIEVVSGNFLAALPVVVQVVVLASVYQRKPWAYIAVKIWACLFFLSGAIGWFSFAMAQSVHSTFDAVLKTVMVVLGLFFYYFADASFQK